jgi:hypothetical protein
MAAQCAPYLCLWFAKRPFAGRRQLLETLASIVDDTSRLAAVE